MAHTKLIISVTGIFFLLNVIVSGATRNNSSNIIKPDSVLFPGVHPTSWSSPAGLFAFGFYQEGNGYAVGIWLISDSQNIIVWTANRDEAPVSPNTTLEFTREGRLILKIDNRVEKVKPILGNITFASSASMLDSGNFVLFNASGHAIWESFDHPTDTILGGQILAEDNKLVSSKSRSDHSSGRFFLSMQTDGNLVAYPVNKSGSSADAYYSINTWDHLGLFLSLNNEGLLYLTYNNSSVDTEYVLSNISYPGNTDTTIYRATLDPDGNFRLFSHRLRARDDWIMKIEWSALHYPCQPRGICGVNSFCSTSGSNADCICFPGFDYCDLSMKFLGCYRNFVDEQGCGWTEPTLSYNITALDKVEFGGLSYSTAPKSVEECVSSCLADCNCWAALYNSGACNMHKLPLVYGIKKKYSSAIAFIKVSFPNPHNIPDDKNASATNQRLVFDSRRKLVLILSISLGILAFVCSLAALSSFLWYRQGAHHYEKLSRNGNQGLNGEFTLRSFSYAELEKATDVFKEVVGRSSFGAVYKGFIDEGKKIVAVKRLEKVVEGEREFRAEMVAIGRTHHINLVQLLGFCIEGTKKLLVYDFMHNGSLADLLFKGGEKPNWKNRVRIAMDVARGILYLHEECEVRIAHCNLKPQNILMDNSWTAKISDFGLAKLLLPNQTGTFTRIRGTLGYLAPEWHKNIPISEKVDVYSFGVVLLEIVCCRSNTEVNAMTADEVLLSSWVYSCFVNGELNKLVGDEEVEIKSLEKMVKIGLLCIQDDPNLRPSMKNVILMIEGTVNIPIPPSPTPFILTV